MGAKPDKSIKKKAQRTENLEIPWILSRSSQGQMYMKLAKQMLNPDTI